MGTAAAIAIGVRSEHTAAAAVHRIGKEKTGGAGNGTERALAVPETAQSFANAGAAPGSAAAAPESHPEP